MVRGGGWMAALCLGLVGCSRGDAPDAGSPELAAVQRDERCAEVVPAPLRAAFLAGWEERTPRQLGSAWVADPLVCTFAHAASRARLTITSDCRTPAKPREIEAVREQVLSREGSEVTGMGKAAVRAKPERELEQLTAWDDDSPCTWTVTWNGEGREQALELLRGLLNPSALPAPVTPEPVAAPGDAGEPLSPNLLEP